MHTLLRSCAAGLMLTLSVGAHAAPVALSTLLGGGVVVAGGLQFDSWSVTSADASSAGFNVDSAQIEVTGLVDGGQSPGPGLQFALLGDKLLAEGDGAFAYKSLVFSYRVTLLDPMLRIVGASMALNQWSVNYTPDGVNDLGLLVSGSLGAAAGGTELAVLDTGSDTLDDVITETPDAAQTLAPGASLFVSTSIFTWATDVGDAASLGQFSQRFQLADAPAVDVPEPGGMALSLVALVAAGAAMRRTVARRGRLSQAS